MSIPLFIFGVSLAALLAALLGAFAMRAVCLRTEHDIREGQREWKFAAERNKAEAAKWEKMCLFEMDAHGATIKKCESFIKENSKGASNLAAMQKELTDLIVFIWGAPPLDRTVKHVCEYITELRMQIASDEQKKAALAAYAEGLSQKLRNSHLPGSVTAKKPSTSDAVIRALFELAKNNWALGVFNDEKGMYFLVSEIEKEGRQMGRGSAPLEAVEDALLAKERSSHGLSS